MPITITTTTIITNNPCAWEYCLTVHWRLHHMYAMCLVESFYHLRQLKTVGRSPYEAAANTMVHAFITSRTDYCNSVMHSLSAVHLRPKCRSHLRSAVQGNFVICYCRTKQYRQRNFAYSGPDLWNSLPLTKCDPSLSLSQFCAKLKTVMFSRAQWYIPIAPVTV